MANPLKILKLKADGFQFIQELPIDAPPKKVWSSLINVAKWFVWDPNPKKWPKQKLEAWPGGRWITTFPDGVSHLHTIVTHIDPNKLLRMSGPMGLSHLPAISTIIFELQPKAGGKETLLRLGHRAFGFMDAGVKQRYSSGWKEILPKLKKLAEKR